MKPIRVRLRPTAETIIRQGHPWVFAESVTSTSGAAESDFAVIYDRNDKFLAIGIYDAASPLRIRVLHQGSPVQINDEWWHGKMAEALKRRESIIPADTDGYRCLYGESEGFPGLVLDRYADTFVYKIYLGFWLKRLDLLNDLLPAEAERAVVRISRNIQEENREYVILKGEEPKERVIFQEHGIKFEVDVLKGQKTGFFLDQRENRREIETHASGKTVLNAFSFSGGFSLYAARGGATEVTSVDISAHAIASAERNFQLNLDNQNIRRAKHHVVKANVFRFLEEIKQSFDVVIVDPPSMAKKASDKESALKGYHKLTSTAVRKLNKQGLLFMCSCSGHVTEKEFYEVVLSAVKSVRRPFAELRRTAHPPDHPAAFPEANYLKGIYLRVD